MDIEKKELIKRFPTPEPVVESFKIDYVHLQPVLEPCLLNGNMQIVCPLERRKARNCAMAK